MRISVTTIEEYRRVVQTEYAKEEELVARIKGQPFESRWQMEAGTAWDKALRNRKVYKGYEIALNAGPVEVDGFKFQANDIRQARAARGTGLEQVKATKVLDTLFGPATVVAKADLIKGLTIQEDKAKFSGIDPAEYEPSLQWRWYLKMFSARMFRYNLFGFGSGDDEKSLVLKEIYMCRFWNYDNLEADCLHWLNEFLAWCDRSGLLPYLERGES